MKSSNVSAALQRSSAVLLTLAFTSRQQPWQYENTYIRSVSQEKNGPENCM